MQNVWGSYWHDGQWGFKCCNSLIKESYCTGAAGKEASQPILSQPPTESLPPTLAIESTLTSVDKNKTEHEIPSTPVKKSKKKKKSKKRKRRKESSSDSDSDSKEEKKSKKKKKKNKKKKDSSSDSSSDSENENVLREKKIKEVSGMDKVKCILI